MVEAPQMIHRHNCLNVSLSNVGVLPYNSARQPNNGLQPTLLRCALQRG
jgi:hypothetical protein